MKHNEKLIPVSIAMPIGLARRIRVLAAQQDRSRSQLVREMLENALIRTEDQGREVQDE